MVVDRGRMLNPKLNLEHRGKSQMPLTSLVLVIAVAVVRANDCDWVNCSRGYAYGCDCDHGCDRGDEYVCACENVIEHVAVTACRCAEA